MMIHSDRSADFGRLAASIAHEVDQPLAAIHLHAQAALRCVERARAPREAATALAALPALLDALLDASRQASDIVRSMRALAAGASARRAPCRLDTLLAAVLAPHAADLERLDVVWRTTCGPGARTALAHPVQLRQLLRNLVANAIDALRPVHGRRRRLAIDARLDAGGDLRLTVRDNGAGLAPGLAGRVFEPLVTSKPGGLGLGLAVCRAIADAHGGRIWAEPAHAGNGADRTQGGAAGCAFVCVLPQRARAEDSDA